MFTVKKEHDVLQLRGKPTEFDQNNRDVTSIFGYVIKKNSSRGAKHGASERQKMYYQPKQMLKDPSTKARTPESRCMPKNSLGEAHLCRHKS